LPENRTRVQINAGEILWQRDPGRARSLFSLAAESVAEMMRNTSAPSDRNERRDQSRGRSAAQLRQELVLTAARYDAQLAYQLLAATRPPAASGDSRNLGAFDSEDNLEQRLLSEIAALDPKLALQNAELMLEKGQYSRSLADVLAQLNSKDKDAAARLEDKLVKRLQAANMISTIAAGSLALSLLRTGPRPPENSGASLNAGTAGLLSQSSYTSLLGAVIDNALKVTPPSAINQRRVARGRGSNRGGTGGVGAAGQINPANEPTTAELEQQNARRMLAGLQMLLPQIDQHLPARAQSVRQKLTESGVAGNSRLSGQPFLRTSPEATSATLMAVAPQVPQQAQSRVYEQAAMRALEEGNPDLARQIANEHLEPNARNSVLQAVEFRQTSEKLGGTKMEEVRQTLSGLGSDEERVNLLLRLSNSSRQNNPKFALQLLDEARQLVGKRAGNYPQFNLQLRVAEEFINLEPSRSFEVLEPVILQLNELLSAAAILNGFEVNVFRDGELPLEGRGALSTMISSFGQLLGRLAKSDFDRSQMLADRFQLPEGRIVARLAIVRNLLELEPIRRGPNFNPRRFGQTPVVRLPQ
ncbi:MAG: hypothetical protein ACRD8U_01385, partial [Pyrinomonadaceae bacterium]